MFWVLKSAVVGADVWELALSWWRVIRLRRLVFRLRHVQFFRKNRQSFPWKCFEREQLLLDLAHLETPIQSTAVYFRAHTRKSMIHNRDRIFRAFLSTNRYEPFLERLTNCVGSNVNKFFWQLNAHAILNVCWSH